MTVNWRRSLLFFALFIDAVFSVQDTFSEDHLAGDHPVCSDPYTCLPTSECAERHSVHGTEEVLFKCGGGQNVCCPPLRPSLSTPPPAQGVPNIYTTTTERTNGGSCIKCSSQQSRPQSISGGGEHPVAGTSAKVPEGHQHHGVLPHHVHEHQPPQSGQSQSSEAARPVQAQEGRRPPQSQRPQSSQTSSQSQKPQSSQARPQPQKPQSSQTQPQSQRPQSSQTQPQSQKPQSSQQSPQSQKKRPPNSQKQSPLASHRNFRLLPTESECGVNNFANRITEGEEVSLGEYPWMVLTGLKDRYGNSRWNCGGTLINGWYVLTAAHCLVVDNRTIEFVRLGEHSLTNETDCYRDVCLEPPEDVAIAELIPHEKWNTTTIKNDIALLRLSRNPLSLGKSNIYPICLPVDTEKLNITSSTKYEVAGWGKTDWNAEEGSDVLRKASISGVNREECNICKDKKKQQYCPIIDTQLCVQGWKSVDVCKGDSGGPLMVTRLNIYQIGITSFKGSEYCGAENIPSIFTKVESYMPWILENIRA